MKWWKLALHSYLYGMAAMFLFLLTYCWMASSWWELWYWIQAIVMIPVTPVGLPFFFGSMYGAKKYFDKVSQNKYSLLKREDLSENSNSDTKRL